MKMASLSVLIVAGAVAALAGTLGLSGGVGVDAPAIAVVNGAKEVSGVPSPATAATPISSPCTSLTSSTGAVDPAPGTTRCGLPSGTTLQDRVWFGTYWQLLPTPIVVGGGYTNARIDRTSDGDFFDGIVDKVDANGRVTDVVLAFAGAQGIDAVQGESILLGIPLDEAARATRVYEQLLNDPRYAHARIHVTGHSLGAGYTQYVLAYALATHGAVATDARADFLGFGAPNWLASAAAHFGVDPAQAAARMVDFTAANDPVLLNGVVRIGINNYLPAFKGLPGLSAAFDVIAAHYPTTYAAALGLPDWLSDAHKVAATAALSAQFQTGGSISPRYGPAGKLALAVDGSAGAEWIEGLGGDDRLVGRAGADVLTGGAGADTFVYTARLDSGATTATADWITDFSQREGDRIDLSALSPLRPLVFVGTAPFSGARQVRIRHDGGDTWIEIELGGDASPDMMVRLSGRVPLVASDVRLAVR